MILILQVFIVVALVSCFARVISAAIESFFFGPSAIQHDELVGWELTYGGPHLHRRLFTTEPGIGYRFIAPD